MTPARWRQVAEIFNSAVRLEPSRRRPFLDAACANDQELQREVDCLLAHDQRAQRFLESPALELAGLLPETPPQLSAGDRLGPYLIMAVLGAGGMGEVYSAADTRLDRTVAVKLLSRQLAQDAHALERFQREARAASALNHPNICTLFDIGEHEGRPFLVMELLEGHTLQQRLAAGSPLPVETALGYGVQISDALDAAHQKGFIHRDLKPANVMVAPSGRIKVLDFGIAKRVPFPAAPSAATRVTGNRDITVDGVVAGTAAYMSPEQARGEDLDARSDLFSFGAVLYEMVTGCSAFPGDSRAAVVEDILTKVPQRPRGINPEVPEELERIILTAMEKDRDLRAQSAAELRAELKELELTMLAPEPRRRSRIVWPAVALAIALIGLAGWRLVSRRDAGRSWKDAAFSRLTNQPGQELSPSLSPDGRSFVYASRASGNWDIYLQVVGGKNAANLTKQSSADDRQPAFSPDGTRIAFRSEREGGGIFVMGTSGEPARRLSGFGYDPSWSPDGRHIVCGTSTFSDGDSRPTTLKGQLFAIPATGGPGSSDRRLISAGIEDAVQPNWSPGGRRVAFWSIRGGNRDVWTLPSEGGSPVQVTRDPSTDWHPVWSPDGRHLYFLSDRNGTTSLWRVPIDERSGRTSGPPEQITTPSSQTLHFSLSLNSHRLAYVNRIETGNVHRVEFDPLRETVVGGSVAVTRGSWRALFPDVSPDGQWVAFSTYRRPEDLYVSRVDGTGLRQLTDDEHRDRVPRWSPDGKRLAFYSSRSGIYQIWAIRPDRTGLQQLTRVTGADGVTMPVWSPDGARLAFSGMNTTTTIMETGEDWNERSQRIPPPPEACGQVFRAYSWSPDGRRLAGYCQSAAGSNGISVYSLDSRRYQHFTGYGWLPHWLRDGRRLVFGFDDGIYLLDTGSGRAGKLLSVSPDWISGVAPSPDNRQIYFGLSTVEADVWLMSRD